MCFGWDMLCKFEVDFVGGDENRVGEGIYVVIMGYGRGE